MNSITLNGKQYPYRQTMGAAIRFKRLTGREISTVLSDSLEDAMLIIYCGVVSACNADKVTFDYDFDTFCDHLDMAVVESLNKEGSAKAQKKSKGA